MDIVNAFEYFDDKNRERVQNVKEKLMAQRSNLNDVKDILELVKIKIERNEENFKSKGASSGAAKTGGGASQFEGRSLNTWNLIIVIDDH